MESKRVRIFTILFISFLFAMTVKFFVLGVIRGEEFEQAARKQRVTGTSIEKDRGLIFDRNMIPLTNRSVKVVACLIPERLKNYKDAVKDVAELCNVSQSKALASLEGTLPVFLEVDNSRRELLSQKYGDLIPFIMITNRYDSGSVASHITGYIREADEIGETGLEKYYNDIISSDSRKAVIAVSDAKNQPIKGFGYVLAQRGDTSKKPMNIKLTLDFRIQKICEKILKDKGVSGAVVVQDIASGDLLAMASSPDFDRNNVSEYLLSEKNELINKATSAYNIGSVFKIVVAAKALEMGAEYNYSYYCSGSYEVGELEFKCHSYKTGGHGILDLKGAMAQSCNAYFIDLGLELGMDNILEMANRLGFGQTTGIMNQGISENAGNLPTGEFYSSGDVANMSIGQGEVLVTPVQIANMLTTIANGGVQMTPNIVEGICDDDGKITDSIKKESRTRVMKVSTAQELHGMLSDVVMSGTAQGLQRYFLNGAAGKTGSAETGRYDDGGKQIVHSWFGGYFPESSPKYTISVFVENGVTLSIPATEVFGEIAQEIVRNKL
jgi:peptidoglycan glycosyltransferase/penicillin-binding protein 2